MAQEPDEWLAPVAGHRRGTGAGLSERLLSVTDNNPIPPPGTRVAYEISLRGPSGYDERGRVALPAHFEL